MRFRVQVVLIIVAGAALQLRAATTESDLNLTYDKPAEKWTEALPIGNGRIGAMVFGGTEDERLQINESTLWGGGPHDYTNPEAHTNLDEIRRLIFAGKVDDAEKLSATMMGQPKLLMPYQPFCDLRLHFPGHGQTTNYRRELHLNDAIAETAYKTGSARFQREAFISYPDQVLVVRITASEAGRLTFTASLDSPQPETSTVSTANDTLQLNGQIQPRQNPARSWTGSWIQPGMRFVAVLRVMNKGGSVRSEDGRLEIAGADSVTILFSDATSFRSYLDVGGDALGVAQDYMHSAEQRSYEQLRQRHLDDFRRLFSRVALRLGEDHAMETTDRRIQNFAKNDDPGLVALYFEFGRYLLIASSRPGGQPANLQGIWNQDLVPAWSSKWTTNINLEMNYWQADAGDLWETEEPLWGLVRDLQVTGAETARVHYHSKGWVLHHNTDLWRADHTSGRLVGNLASGRGVAGEPDVGPL